MITNSIETTDSKYARLLYCGAKLPKRAAIALTVMMSLAGWSMAADDGFVPINIPGFPGGILPAGVACQFPLKIEFRAALHRPADKTFVDENDNPVRILSVGKGQDLRFTNTISGAELILQGNGSVSKTTFNADGTVTVVTAGHNVISLFPTDVPAGPSTILYVGQVVYTVDSEGIFTLLKVSGKQTDICAELSS